MPVLAPRQLPAEEVTDAMARIYVWLRYSASRQLTWQRNYNTQPRILGEAQARLTNAVAAVRPPLSPFPLNCDENPPCVTVSTWTMYCFGVTVSFAACKARAACAIAIMQAGCGDECVKLHQGAVTCMWLTTASLCLAAGARQDGVARRRSGCGPCWAPFGRGGNAQVITHACAVAQSSP